MSSTTLILDTNVLLACIRGGALGTRIITQYNLKSNAFDSLICVVSVGELYALEKRLNWGSDRVNAMKALLASLVVVDINSEPVLTAYAEIDQFSDGKGRRMGKNDVWIAAVAKVTGASLLTTDKDFDHLDKKHISRIWIDPILGK